MGITEYKTSYSGPQDLAPLAVIPTLERRRSQTKLDMFYDLSDNVTGGVILTMAMLVIEKRSLDKRCYESIFLLPFQNKKEVSKISNIPQLRSGRQTSLDEIL